MSVEAVYRCNGCPAEARVSGLMATLEVIRPGRVLDLCVRKTPTIEGSAPEGWVAFDPYTGLTYCPKCWDMIEAGETLDGGA